MIGIAIEGKPVSGIPAFSFVWSLGFPTPGPMCKIEI